MLYFCAVGLLISAGYSDTGWVTFTIAAFPVLLLMLFVDVFSSRLNDYWAGGNLKQSTRRLSRFGEPDDLYFSAPPEVQEQIDYVDDLSYGKNVSILSGLLVAVSAPVVGFLHLDWVGFVAAIPVCAVAVAFSRWAIQGLNQQALKKPKIYEAHYENQ